MAQYKKHNLLTSGLSGKLGNVVVFRQLRNKTVMANRPSKPKKESEIQKNNRSLFRDASRHAKHCMLDPEKKEYFRNIAVRMDWPNPYTAALTTIYRDLKGLSPIVLPPQRREQSISTNTLQALMLVLLNLVFTVASAIAARCSMLRAQVNRQKLTKRKAMHANKALSIHHLNSVTRHIELPQHEVIR